MSGAWARYVKVLERFPLVTQMVQTGLICGGGDVTAQFLIEKRGRSWTKRWDEWDKRRTLNFTLLGSFFVAPSVRGWYLTLERMYGTAVTTRTTLLKVGTDQLGFAPIFSGIFIGLIGVTQGVKLNLIFQKLKREWWDVVVTGWKIWPAAQLLNFYYVPFLVRPLFVSVVALFWNSYLAWRTNRDKVF